MDKNQLVDDDEIELSAEAREAKRRLSRGLRSSRAIVMEYRARLIALRRSSEGAKPDRPLFRWDRKH